MARVQRSQACLGSATCTTTRWMGINPEICVQAVDSSRSRRRRPRPKLWIVAVRLWSTRGDTDTHDVVSWQMPGKASSTLTAASSPQHTGAVDHPLDDPSPAGRSLVRTPGTTMTDRTGTDTVPAGHRRLQRCRALGGPRACRQSGARAVPTEPPGGPLPARWTWPGLQQSLPGWGGGTAVRVPPAAGERRTRHNECRPYFAGGQVHGPGR